MSATATILNIWCLRQATGTDAGVNQALADLAPSIPFEDLGGGSLADFVTALPGVVAAIDSARADPDNLYLTAETSGGLENSIWPPDQATVDMQAGQSAAPGVTVPVAFSQNLSLFDRDWPSGEDLLGSVTTIRLAPSRSPPPRGLKRRPTASHRSSGRDRQPAPKTSVRRPIGSAPPTRRSKETRCAKSYEVQQMARHRSAAQFHRRHRKPAPQPIRSDSGRRLGP